MVFRYHRRLISAALCPKDNLLLQWFFVRYKKVDVYVPRQTQRQRIQHHTHGYDRDKHRRHTKMQQEAYCKDCNRQRHIDRVTYVHGSIKERRFDLVFKPAMAALLIHFQYTSQIIGVRFSIHTFLMASRTSSC